VGGDDRTGGQPEGVEGKQAVDRTKEALRTPFPHSDLAPDARSVEIGITSVRGREPLMPVSSSPSPLFAPVGKEPEREGASSSMADLVSTHESARR
jgi:hypothetical protein